MKRILKLILFISFIGCEKDDITQHTVMAQIEERTIPDTVMVNEDVQLFIRASGQCYNYELNVKLQEKEQFSYTLKAYGTFTCYGTCKCPASFAYKDTIIHFQPTRKGTYLFAISERKNKTDIDTMIVN